MAIAELVSRGKEQLVLIRPYRRSLMLHTMYYAHEVRDFKQVPKGENVTAPAPKHSQIIDIMEALKRSMESSPGKKKSVTAPVKKKRKHPNLDHTESKL